MRDRYHYYDLTRSTTDNFTNEGEATFRLINVLNMVLVNVFFRFSDSVLPASMKGLRPKSEPYRPTVLKEQRVCWPAL